MFYYVLNMLIFNSFKLCMSSYLQNILSCKKVGSVFRQGRERLVSMAADQSEATLVCHVRILVTDTSITKSG